MPRMANQRPKRKRRRPKRLVEAGPPGLDEKDDEEELPFIPDLDLGSDASDGTDDCYYEEPGDDLPASRPPITSPYFRSTIVKKENGEKTMSSKKNVTKLGILPWDRSTYVTIFALLFSVALGITILLLAAYYPDKFRCWRRYDSACTADAATDELFVEWLWGYTKKAIHSVV